MQTKPFVGDEKRSAKPLYVGSIPTRASILFLQLHESTVLAIVQALRFRSASMGESRAANCVNARWWCINHYQSQKENSCDRFGLRGPKPGQTAFRPTGGDHRTSSTAIMHNPPASAHLIGLPSVILCQRLGSGRCSNSFRNF